MGYPPFYAESEKEIAFVRNTTHGVIIAAGGIDWRAGDNVVIPANDFPANVIPWRCLADRGVEVRYAPDHDGGYCVDDFAALVDDRTRAVSVSWVHFSTGFRIDLKSLGQLCQERNCLLFVDAIQGLGALPIDVKELGIDYLTADGHKWLLSPEGAGIFYASQQARLRLDSNILGWMSLKRPMDLMNYGQPAATSARRFEEGSLNVLGIHALSATLKLLLEVGAEQIWAAVRKLNDELVDGLRRKEYTIHSSLNEEERSGIICFSHRRIPAAEIAETLNGKGIMISERCGRLRAAPHFYNTSEQLDRLLEALPA